MAKTDAKELSVPMSSDALRSFVSTSRRLDSSLTRASNHHDHEATTHEADSPVRPIMKQSALRVRRWASFAIGLSFIWHVVRTGQTVAFGIIWLSCIIVLVAASAISVKRAARRQGRVSNPWWDRPLPQDLKGRSRKPEAD